MAISKSDLVITSEGCFDKTTFLGKAPWHVINRCSELGVKVCLFAGFSRIEKHPLIDTIHTVFKEPLVAFDYDRNQVLEKMCEAAESLPII